MAGDKNCMKIYCSSVDEAIMGDQPLAFACIFFENLTISELKGPVAIISFVMSMLVLVHYSILNSS